MTSAPSVLPFVRVAPRVLSIDVLRGLTIALMILVNDPGDAGCVYPQLQHAEWNGYTAADLVFPNFLFLGGASLVFSLQGRIERGADRWELARGLGRRGVNLIALKLVLAMLPSFRLRRIRIFGVLFRTAVCSVAGGLILLGTLEIPMLVGIVGAMLTGYYGALRISFGRMNAPLLDPENNLAAALDRKVAHLLHGELHTGALYNVTHDPEGLLSSVPAVGTTLLGAVAALVMRHPRLTQGQKVGVLAASGVGALGVGSVWGRSFPVNKNLWTSSYVLVAGGWSLLALGGIYWCLDVRRPSARTLRAIRPAQIFGANALVAYAVSVAGHKVARTVHVPCDGHSVSLRTFAYRRGFARGGSTRLRSLGFAVAYAAVCFLPNLILWRRKVFVKI
ncbi:acyltransferase family protein [Granulicella tundricola]|uniref:Heparan-alpha-glucosaminide N-acetyltransferase catalytic domain-containing protein n=1 Tax=Granulicella tundricola (strain ATCC BAA-1859 / DSM 23138 / MP5ACTX9) TaxID=1198114 RepID=E8X5F2_GRATM|nr:heparan-alpha-glucosaminide N-acetyltransferase domain-containing protein [Granulicella tundricola]ADW69499.1 hypothetical protein AciX9_2466 [Granulicella tundricola MP5ACTX9]